MMSLLDALQTLVIFALERGGDDEVMVKRAIAEVCGDGSKDVR